MLGHHYWSLLFTFNFPFFWICTILALNLSIKSQLHACCCKKMKTLWLLGNPQSPEHHQWIRVHQMGCVVTADLWLKSVSDCSIFFYLVIKPFHLVYLYLKFSTVYCLSYRYYYNDLMFEILLASNGFSLSFCKTL